VLRRFKWGRILTERVRTGRRLVIIYYNEQTLSTSKQHQAQQHFVHILSSRFSTVSVSITNVDEYSSQLLVQNKPTTNVWISYIQKKNYQIMNGTVYKAPKKSSIIHLAYEV
jgi:hypothetical protein